MDPGSKEQPLLDYSSSEISTCLGQSDEVADELHHQGQRSRYISIDQQQQRKKSQRRAPWNSWTGESPISIDNRRRLAQEQLGIEPESPSRSRMESDSSLMQPIHYSRHDSMGMESVATASHKSSVSSIGRVSEGGRVISDGEDDPVTSLQHTTEFENVTASSVSAAYGWNSSTSKSLNFCKKYNLRHYNNLLKWIGWKKFHDSYDQPPLWIRLVNFFYPLFMFTMIVFACVAQIMSCFGRDRSLPPAVLNHTQFNTLQCNEHIITASVSSYVLILLSYASGFYVFRRAEAEHLSALTETVFLSFNYTSMRKSRNRLVFILLAFLICGFVWVLMSLGVSILRLYALGLHNHFTIIHWYLKDLENVNLTVNSTLDDIAIPHYEVYHYVFVSAAILGFVFFDLLYIAVTINFCYQCQLLNSYVENIIDKVQNRKYKTMSAACKEIYQLYEFLKVLNGKVSFLMSLIMLVFFTAIIDSYQNLRVTEYQYKKNIALGFLNLIQWISITAIPLLTASLFTATAKRLSRLGLQIAARPFVYSETSELDLQYFLNYAQSARFSVRIAFVPMYPSVVMGVIILLTLMVTVGIGIPRIQTIYWF